ncbi:MCP four helix bundle domain-containing protein [Hymenobacter glacialis]|uniref:Chemotaxis methyl-accepting receptor HlyB-like 4HB MCP domain-containing protein n=1 Tax=Hymenobacter glacialis TaxID=1908236 RepID=A0A1G1TBD9_9BACT|nr:MCP four helix bundle domain-containing protein [Hymenobacter glacialis]OGX88156.1 hypothetical protein BEN48_10015 [Hymenobacter glacialis]
MNILSRIHNKAKPLLLFLVVMVAILGSSVLEKNMMRDLKVSVSSLYQDRLMPATGLFQLNDLMYTKQQLMRGYLADSGGVRLPGTQAQLARHNQEVVALVAGYQATYMVADEGRVFQDFKAHLRHYNALEAQLLATPAASPAAQTRALEQEFNRIHSDLRSLNLIQQRVGQELSQSSVVTEGNATTLSNLKIALLIIFTLVIQHALLTSRHPLVPKSMQNFNLN